MQNGKSLSTLILGFATIAAGVLVPRVASAYSYVGMDHNTSFNGYVSSCDSYIDGWNVGQCSIPEWTSWWSGGRAGYATVSGNTYLWLSNDDSIAHWNSWNAYFNPTASGGGYQTAGECSFDLDVIAGGTSTVAYVDLWYNKQGAGLTYIGDAAITGTSDVWEKQYLSSISLNSFLADWSRPASILVVVGRYPGQSGSQFIAVDNFHAYCTHN
ncbi:MAG: hypothetical protein JWM74_1599 [Myxococcaceae bacterium]|nr:hypothetical protein [Myxococcaceae bacterium]